MDSNIYFSVYLLFWMSLIIPSTQTWKRDEQLSHGKDQTVRVFTGSGLRDRKHL